MARRDDRETRWLPDRGALTRMFPRLAGALGDVAAWLRTAGEDVEDLMPTEAAAPDARYVEVDGHPVAYRDLGAGGPVMLLLHCFAGRMETWRSLQLQLAAHVRTVAFDLWGFGASGRPSTLRPGDWTRQVFGLMDRLGIASAVLAGHSMGGRVALKCVAQQPARVHGVVLISADSLPLPQGYPSLWALAHSPLLALVQYLLVHRPDLILQLMRGAYPDDFPISMGLIRQYQQPLRVRGTTEAFRHLGSTYHGEDLALLAEQIADIRCPALLLWGARDRVTPVRHALRLADVLHDAEMVVLPRTHHLPHEERPAVVAGHIRRFLLRCTA